MDNKTLKNFIESLTNGDMIDSIFGYAYKRCFSEYEAEDLCHEIIAEILLTLQKSNGDIVNLNAYIWQIAHNTYTKYVKKQKRARANHYPLESALNFRVDIENDVLERIVDADNLSRIKREISALPEIYKNVMIMYYFDGLSIAETAKNLGIPENRVKQRLFAAREKIRKEVSDMTKKSTDQTEKTNQNKKLYSPAEICILDSLVSTVENRLQGTGEHPERASLFVKILIAAMLKKGVYADEMKDWDADLMASASRVHDIGKLAVPDSILMNKGALTQEEVNIMRRHTVIGEEILQIMYISDSGDTPLLNHAKVFAGSHHEYWNGEGFPRGLKGEEIPLQGRIMIIADWYETLVSERPYKKAFTPSEAENIIKANSGVHFDPKITAVFDDNDVKKLFAETAKQLF